MKHCLSVILVLCLLCSNAAMAADKPHSDTDILFRNIQWGVSINDVSTALCDAGLPEGRTSHGFTVNDVDYRYATDNVGIRHTIDESSLNKIGGFYIAGHRVSEVRAMAIYGIVDGAISKDTADSKFYNATYYFEVPADKSEAQGVFDDLQQKMTVLYGEPGVIDGTKTVNRVAWYGKDYHTMAVMYYYPNSMSQLYIEYWNNMVVEDIKALQQIMYTGDLSSSDGL